MKDAYGEGRPGWTVCFQGLIYGVKPEENNAKLYNEHSYIIINIIINYRQSQKNN